MQRFLWSNSRALWKKWRPLWKLWKQWISLWTKWTSPTKRTTAPDRQRSPKLERRNKKDNVEVSTRSATLSTTTLVPSGAAQAGRPSLSYQKVSSDMHFDSQRCSVVQETVQTSSPEAEKARLQSDSKLHERFATFSEVIHLTSAEDPPSSTAKSPQRRPLNLELSAKLERLSVWRLAETDIEIPESAMGFTGGSATVFRAVLTSTGSSGLSTARKAKQMEHGQVIAVKEMRIRTEEQEDLEKALKAALREADILAELSHPNIIDLVGFVVNVDAYKIWLIFKWAKNGNLRDFVASRNWAVPERISLIIDVIRGVEYLHTRSPPICHGDLKAINILVGADGHALITDLGNARYVVPKDHPEDTDSPCLDTEPGQELSLEATFSKETGSISITGNGFTMRWAAPEVLMQRRGGTKSDIWSLGWVFYEASVMTGAMPFEGESNQVIVLQRIVQGDLPSISNHARLALIKQLASFVIRCWNINSRARPTAEELGASTRWMPVSVPLFGNESDSVRRNFGLLKTLGIMYDAQGEVEEAISILNEALALQSDNITKHERANVLLLLTKMQQTQLVADQTVQFETVTDPKAARAHALLGLAEAHREPREHSEAIKPYTEAAQILAEIGDKDGRLDATLGLAETRREQGDSADAIEPYTEAAQTYGEIGGKEDRADALYQLAEVHRYQDEFSDAIELYTEAVQIYAEIGSKHDRANTLWGLAEAHRGQKDLANAADLYTQSARIYGEIGLKENRADALYQLGEAHFRQGDYANGIEPYTEAAQIYAEIESKQGIARALWGLGDAYLQQREYANAVGPFTESARIYGEIGPKKNRADALHQLADAHLRQGDYADAIELYTEVAQIYAEIGSKQVRARALLGLGDTYFQQREYANAVGPFTESARVYGEIGLKKNQTDALYQLAQVHRYQDEFSDAIELYTEVAQIYAEIGSKHDRANTLWGLAEAHRGQKDLANAVNLYTQSAQIYGEIGLKENRADALYQLGEAHFGQGDYANGIEPYTEAAQIYAEIESKQGRARALWGLGDAYLHQREYANAVGPFTESARIYDETGNKPQKAYMLWGLGKAYLEQMEYANAVGPYAESARLYDEVGRKEDRVKALHGLAQAHCRNQCHSLAFNTFDQLTVLCGELGLIAEAQECAARSLRCQNHLRDQLKSA